MSHVRIKLLDTKTGKEVSFIDENIEYDSDDVDKTYENCYRWYEGNEQCDCNRASYFKGNKYKDIECGDGRFKVISWENIE